MSVDIFQITSYDTLKIFLNVVRDSFKTVADEFGLNQLNSPTNPAFTTMENLELLWNKATCFGLSLDHSPAGFFAIEQRSNGDTAYLERLCIMPQYRHNGLGSSILKFSDDFCMENNIAKISVGIINSNMVLKKWYICNGYDEVMVKKFPHLIFEVCFLEKNLKQLPKIHST